MIHRPQFDHCDLGLIEDDRTEVLTSRNPSAATEGNRENDNPTKALMKGKS